MILKRNQQQAFNNIVKYGKAFIFWGRQTGKSYLLSQIIQTFAVNTKSSDILFFTNNKNKIQHYRDKILMDCIKVMRTPNRNKKPKPEELFLINNNYITFCSIKEYDYYLEHLKPSLIIFDDFLMSDSSQFDRLIKYILYNNNTKCVFASYKINLNLVKKLDRNDFYINIMPSDNDYPYPFPNQIDDRDKIIITQEILEYIATKPDELVDYDDVIFKRRKKLKQLKLLSEDNDS